MSEYLTKREVLQDFNENIKPFVIEQFGDDDCAMSQAWNDYTDGLCKNGQISDHQYNTWSNPF